MRKAKTTSSPATGKIMAGVAALGFAGVIAGAMLAVVPRHAAALAAYSQKEGKACGYCHVNPAGGGPRNARGKRYEANGHSFAKKR